MVGDLSGYGTVWYHPTGIANILSLSRAIKIFTITYVSANGNEFRMHKKMERKGCSAHRWGLPGNYPVFTVVMVIYHYVERIWRIIVTPILIYNIYDH